MTDISELRSHLELCSRLGIRYVSMGTQENVPVMDRAVPRIEETISTPVVPPVTADPPAIPGENVTALEGKPNWLTGSAETVQAMELKAFERDIHECLNCALGHTRKNFVFGSGNPRAEVLFIGEAPGADEDEQGLPFVGKAGQLLTKIIESTKTWKREDVFICNVLKCRPPANRTPLPEEVESCRSHLEEQIRIIKPKLILALGAVAAQSLMKTKDSVGKLRGKWHEIEGIPLRVTYHPAALLRFEGYKKDVWEDMKELTLKYQQISQK